MKKTLSFGLALVAALMIPMSAQAVCSGHSNSVDLFYSNANPVANLSPEQGWDWQVETTAAGVEITVQFLDNYVGMAAPQLFLFNELGVLIGNPIPMTGWVEATRTATHTLTGYNAGDKIVFLVQIAYADHVLFTERMQYIVGSSCSADEQPTVLGSCSGHSTAVDDYYTSADPAAANPFVLGYDWTVTTTDEAVEIEVSLLDNITGFAAPYIFFFKNGVMDGPDHAMQLLGQKASYSLTDKSAGEEVNFLVKIAYASHVAFTERISYTVGDNCDEATAITPVTPNPSPVTRKFLRDGRLLIERNGKTYTATGSQF
jgi:hypothetical protein